MRTQGSKNWFYENYYENLNKNKEKKKRKNLSAKSMYNRRKKTEDFMSLNLQRMNLNIMSPNPISESKISDFSESKASKSRNIEEKSSYVKLNFNRTTDSNENSDSAYKRVRLLNQRTRTVTFEDEKDEQKVALKPKKWLGLKSQFKSKMSKRIRQNINMWTTKWKKKLNEEIKNSFNTHSPSRSKSQISRYYSHKDYDTLGMSKCREVMLNFKKKKDQLLKNFQTVIGNMSNKELPKLKFEQIFEDPIKWSIKRVKLVKKINNESTKDSGRRITIDCSQVGNSAAQSIPNYSDKPRPTSCMNAYKKYSRSNSQSSSKWKQRNGWVSNNSFYG